MKNIPYNLYIHFDELSFFFNVNSDRKENFLRCGFVSIELSCYLLGNILNKKENNNTDKISYILQGIEKQFNVLKSCDFLLESKGFKDTYSENINNLKLLDQSHAGVIEKITTIYFELSKNVKIGLDNQINEIRNHFFLANLVPGDFEVNDLLEFPNIIKVLKLNELDYFNSEDKMFMIVHQISECWFNIGINELKSIDKLLQDSELCEQKIGHHFKSIFETLIYLSEVILLLEHLVLSDYHPLRVALRGASGGQSQQAYEIFGISRKIFVKFLDIIKDENKNIVQIIENPKENEVFLSIVNHFSKLERSLKNFFFQHYVLTSSVIGSQSFGSIGQDIVSLVDKFIDPLFKEIDQAKYDLTLKTNFQYGNISGALILEKENFVSQNTENHTTNTEIINKVIGCYFEEISNFDQNKWIDLFAEDGYIEDPIGSRPYVGHQQLSVFFKGFLRFFSHLDMTIESKEIEKDSAKVLWKASATSYNGKKINFNGTEVFKISDSGKILTAQVHWDPSIIAEQL